MNELPLVKCITLKNQDYDRKKSFENEVSKLGLNWSYHAVDKHPTSGKIGCFNSHVEIAREIVNNNYTAGLIFEDDLEVDLKIIRNNQGILKEINKFIKEGNFDIFYLGMCVNDKIERIDNYNYIYSTRGYLTHSYVISYEYACKICNLEYIDTEIDVYYKNDKNCRSYCVIPNIAYQKAFVSNINGGCNKEGKSWCQCRENWFSNWDLYISLILVSVVILICIFAVVYMICFNANKLKCVLT